jgi:hypothetical protein
MSRTAADISSRLNSNRAVSTPAAGPITAASASLRASSSSIEIRLSSSTTRMRHPDNVPIVTTYHGQDRRLRNESEHHGPVRFGAAPKIMAMLAAPNLRFMRWHAAPGKRDRWRKRREQGLPMADSDREDGFSCPGSGSTSRKLRSLSGRANGANGWLPGAPSRYQTGGRTASRC